MAGPLQALASADAQLAVLWKLRYAGAVELPPVETRSETMTRRRTWSAVKVWAKACKLEIRALWLASRHPETPWYAKAWLASVVAYAFSPIDLIPDFIPVLGYLDDLILLPLGIWIGVWLVPAPVLAECRLRAQQEEVARTSSWAAAVVVVVVWLAAAGAGAWLFLAAQ